MLSLEHSWHVEQPAYTILILTRMLDHAFPHRGSPCSRDTHTIAFAQLTDADFNQASWDWVQDTTTATNKWGSIEGWDVSKVTSMAYAFSTDRNEVGGVRNSSKPNTKAATFNADLNTWVTTDVTSLVGMFLGATAFNGDVSTFDTAKVKSMASTFQGATGFNGDMGTWDVKFVTDMGYMFASVTSFIHGSVDKWQVTSLQKTQNMFAGATNYNANLVAWTTSELVNLKAMFKGATQFEGNGVASFDVVKGSVFEDMFDQTGITACNQKRIKEAWTANTMFTQPAAWATGASCAAMTTAEFTRASYEWVANGEVKGTALWGPISQWNTSAVTTMTRSFSTDRNQGGDFCSGCNPKAASFNADISDWITAAVKDVASLFLGARVFIGSLAKWDVAAVTNMGFMFSSAVLWNGDVSKWIVAKVKNDFRSHLHVTCALRLCAYAG
jgi:surface protein